MSIDVGAKTDTVIANANVVSQNSMLKSVSLLFFFILNTNNYSS